MAIKGWNGQDNHSGKWELKHSGPDLCMHQRQQKLDAREAASVTWESSDHKISKECRGITSSRHEKYIAIYDPKKSSMTKLQVHLVPSPSQTKSFTSGLCNSSISSASVIFCNKEPLGRVPLFRVHHSYSRKF